MHENRILGYSVVLLGANAIIAIYYFVKAIANTLKKEFYAAGFCFTSAIIFTAIVLKLNYEYYQPLMLIIPLLAMAGLGFVYFRKHQSFLSQFFPVFISGLVFFLLTDRQILKFWNPGLTEYDAKNGLEWTSFQGQPEPQSDKQNYLLPMIKYKFKEIGNSNPSGIVICGTINDSSWTNNANDSSSLKALEYFLKISEIHTRKMRKLFDEESNKKTLLEKMEVLRNEMTEIKNSYQKEVLENNSPEKENYWKKKIDAELDALTQFE